MKFNSVEIKDTQIILANSEILPAQFRIWDWDPHDQEKIRLTLRFSGREITQTDGDYFSAMQSIRREIEKEGMRLHCYGASKNVYPSAMSIDMGAGWKAYKHTLGKLGSFEDLVSIFDSGPDVIPATVDEQEAFFKQWTLSHHK